MLHRSVEGQQPDRVGAVRAIAVHVPNLADGSFLVTLNRHTTEGRPRDAGVPYSITPTPRPLLGSKSLAHSRGSRYVTQIRNR
jgi:hypothetical protein